MVTLEAIYGSKIFKTSTRKDAIISAFNAMSSSRLAVQDPDSLDDQYKSLTKRPEPEKPEAAPEGKGEGDKDLNINISHSGGGAGGGGSFSGEGDVSFDDLVDVPESEEDLESMEADFGEDDAGSNEDTSADDVPVEEATKIDLDYTVLKDILNGEDNTSGVVRLKNKSNELWLYYSDESNLNNIMVDVIDKVQHEFPSLEFNRLARSENAIVFQIPEEDKA